jgi:sugar/nucleoside kinase (ribokinase family)
MKHKVLVMGNGVIDMSFGKVQFPILPSEHQFMRDRLITPGGIANTILCATRLGLKMKVVGNLGDDEMADLWRTPLVAEGVDVSGMVAYKNRVTSVLVAFTDANGEHVFLGHRGKLQMVPFVFPPHWKAAIEASDALFIYGWSYLSMGPEANLEALKIANAANVPVFYDPGPEIPHTTPEWRDAMIEQSTVVLLTHEEAGMIIGESLPPEAMAKRIQNMGPELVILKLGAEGMIGQTAVHTLHQPGFPVAVKDLTGAGDSVLASVMLSYLEGYDLPKMLTLANATGAACVQKFGAGVNVPYKHEVLDVLKKAGSDYSF